MTRKTTYMTGPMSKLLRSPPIEAAKHLAYVARRFVEDRALASDVDEAIRIWQEAVQASTRTPSRSQP